MMTHKGVVIHEEVVPDADVDSFGYPVPGYMYYAEVKDKNLKSRTEHGIKREINKAIKEDGN